MSRLRSLIPALLLAGFAIFSSLLVVFRNDSPLILSKTTAPTASQWLHLNDTSTASAEIEMAASRTGMIEAQFRANERMADQDTTATTRIAFRLYDVASDELIYESTTVHGYKSQDDTFSFPFGFPLQERAPGTELRIELTADECEAESSNCSAGLLDVLVDEDQAPQLETRYFFTKSDLLSIDGLTQYLSLLLQEVTTLPMAFLASAMLIAAGVIAFYKNESLQQQLKRQILVLLPTSALLQLVYYPRWGLLPVSDQLQFVMLLIGSYLAVVTVTAILFQDGDEDSDLNLSKWLQKPWVIPAIVSVLVLLALSLRLPNLGFLDPYTDEYLHLTAIRDIDSGYWQDIYTRSFATVTIPAWLSVQLLGYEVWAARLPMVLLHVLAMVPLYYLLKKIDRTTALIGLSLYATSPWGIAVSRTVREYAVLPLWLFSLLWLMHKIWEVLPEKIRLERDILKLLKMKQLWTWGVPLLLFALYPLTIDSASTYKVFLLFFAVLFAWIIATKLELKPISSWVTGALLGIVSLAGFWYMGQTGQVTFIPQLRTDWFHYFLPPASQQWYAQLFPITSLISLIVGVTSLFLQRKKGLSVFLFASTVILCYFYAFHFDRYVRPRYLYVIGVMLVPLLAYGMSRLMRWMALMFERPVSRVLIFLSLLILFLNPRQSLVPVLNDRHGYVPISAEYHDDLSIIDISNLKYPVYSTLYDQYHYFYKNEKIETVRNEIKDPAEELLPAFINGEIFTVILDSRRVNWYGFDTVQLKTKERVSISTQSGSFIYHHQHGI